MQHIQNIYVLEGKTLDKSRILRIALAAWLAVIFAASSVLPSGAAFSAAAADGGAGESWESLAERTYAYVEAEFVDAADFGGAREDEAYPDSGDAGDADSGAVAASDADAGAGAGYEASGAERGYGENPYGAVKYEAPGAAGRPLRALADDTLAVDSVEVVYGGAVQAKYRPDQVTLGQVSIGVDGKYYTTQRNASITDPRIFHVSAAFENADGKGEPLFGDGLKGAALEAAYSEFLNRLEWTYGEKPLADWKRASGSSWSSALTGAQFITVVGTRLLKSESGYKLEADVRFDTRLNALAGASSVAGNVPYEGYAMTTQGSNSFRPQELNDLVGSYALSVKYVDPSDSDAGKEIGSRPVRLTLYDSYLTWKEADAWARELKAKAEAGPNGGEIGYNGRYVSVQSLTKTLEGNDLWNIVISDSKASVDEYLNVTRPLMESNPALLKEQISRPGDNQKVPLYFSVTHSDETPGPDANVRAAELFLYGEDEISFDTQDNIDNRIYTYNPTTGARNSVGYFSASGDAATRHSFTIDEALDKFIIVINITGNPDGRDHLLRGNFQGIDQNRQASGQVTVEAAAVAADVFKWSPLIDNELHGYVANMLLMPGSGPHAPYYEHDLTYPAGLEQSDFMGRAILGSTPMTRFLTPFYHYRYGWDDGATIYAHNYAVLFGGIGQNIEIPYANEDSVDAFLATFKAIVYDVLKNREELYGNKLEALDRAVNNIDSHETDKWLTDPFTEIPDEDLSKHYSGDVIGRPRLQGADGSELSYFPDYYIIPVDEGTQFNVPEAYRSLEQLERSGAKYRRTTKPVEVDGVTYPAGTYVIDLRQYSRNYIHSVLDAGYNASIFNSTYAEVTVSLPALRGFKSVALWSPDYFEDKSEPVAAVNKPGIFLEGSTEYVVVKTGSTDVVRLVNRLFNAEKPVRIITGYTPYGNIGDFIARSADVESVKGTNVDGEPDDLTKKLTAVVKDFPGGAGELAAVSAAAVQPIIAGVGSPITPQYPQGTSVTGLVYALPFLEFPKGTFSVSTNLTGAIDDYNVIFNDNVSLSGETFTNALYQRGVAYVGARANGINSVANLTNFALGARTAPSGSFEAVFRSTVSPTSSIVSAFADSDVSYLNGAAFFGTLPAGTKRLIAIDDGEDNFQGGFWRNAASLPGGYDYTATQGRVTAIYGTAGEDRDIPITLFGTNVFWRVNTQYYWPLFSQAIFEGASGIIDHTRPYTAADTPSTFWTSHPVSVALATVASDGAESEAIALKQLVKVNGEELAPAYGADSSGWAVHEGAIVIADEGEHYIHWYADNSEAATNQGTYGPYRIDLTSPEVGVSIGKAEGGEVTLIASAYDALSDVASYEWQRKAGLGEWESIGGGASVDVAAPAAGSGVAYRVLVTDYAGNETAAEIYGDLLLDISVNPKFEIYVKDIPSASDGEYAPQFDIKSNGAGASVVALAAAYGADGRLVGLDSVKISLVAGEFAAASPSVPRNPAAESYKFFIFDSSYLPLTAITSLP
jgi:hypothetical protein